MNVYMITFGCTANQSNAEIMAGLLKEAGHELVGEKNAEVVIVNSCTVKSPTERRVLRTIRDFDAAGKKVIVTGCMPEVQAKKIREASPEASLVGINCVTEIVDAVKKMSQGFKVTKTADKKVNLLGKPKVRRNPMVGVIQISQGCNRMCAYCVVRTAKGSLQSFPITSILNEVKDIIASGCKEIWLTCQDTAAYGTDSTSEKILLPALLRNICAIPGDFKIRIGMMNPSSALPMLDDLVSAYTHPKIYKFLHIPVQSGSDKVLKAMNRSYTKREYVMIVEAFRKRFPNITISTDIICGFPGETDADFDESKFLVQDLKFDIVNISRFGVRPMTEAANMQQIPSWKIKDRSRAMTEIVDGITLKRNKTWVGWRGEILVSEVGDKGGFLGRNYAYKPVITQNGKLGDKITLEITEARQGYLIGK